MATDPLGFGFFPFGASPFGYGQPGKAGVSNSPIYQKSDGKEGTARFIDPYSRDYVLTDNGRFLGADEVEQAVYLALTTAKGSSVLSDLGQSFTNLQIAGENLQRRVEDEVNVALNDLIQAEMIELIAVSAQYQNNRLTVKVEWRDVASDSPKETTV